MRSAGLSKVFRVLLLVPYAAFSIGCADPSPSIEVTQAYVVAPTDDIGAMYLRIANHGALPDSLISIEMEIAGRVELHDQVFQDGMVRMEPASDLTIPARGELRMVPGGLHAMLEGLNRNINVGDTLEARLVLKHTGQIIIEAPVVTYTDLGEMFGELTTDHDQHGGH